MNQVVFDGCCDFRILLAIVLGLVDESTTLIALSTRLFGLWLVAHASRASILGTGHIPLSHYIHHFFGKGDSTTLEPGALFILGPVFDNVVLCRREILSASHLNISVSIWPVFLWNADIRDLVNRLVLIGPSHSVVWNSDVGLLLVEFDSVTEFYDITNGNSISSNTGGTLSNNLVTGLGSFSSRVGTCKRSY